jgi:DNA primase
MKPNPPKRPIVEHYDSRITVDLDDKGHDFELAAIKAYQYLLDVADAVDIHVSSSGEGLHLIAYFERPVPFHQQIAHRRAAGDDTRRIAMEIQRWHAGLDVDVLFQQKDVTDEYDSLQVKERHFRSLDDALEHIRKQRTDDYDRVRQLANHGHKGAPNLSRFL